ncbi:HNH endonuclease [Streptomyces chartreusis]|uniref:HNH endonuclease n=1 Tax=Streptomyces chartreusis TaxID=1969 RepID=UPI00369BD481
MLPPRRIHCGEPECKRANNAERARAWHRNYTEATGKRYGTERYREQSIEYYKQRRERLGHWRQLYPEAAALADARRRMLIQQADQGERFAPKDVYDRDDWTCGLCQLPVDPGLPWPHPMSASVDHILPLPQGGSHTLANVQCAHLSCNSRKSDRVDVEMIAELSTDREVEPALQVIFRT